MKDDVTIDSDVDVADVKERLGVGEDEELRESARRERYLRQTVRITSQDNNASLDLTDQAPHVTENDAGERHVVISDQRAPQETTDYDGKVWDLMTQEAATVHEAGHILYTDMPDFRAFIEDMEDDDDFSQREAAIAKTIWNALEDAAIEKQLKSEFASSVERNFETVNGNLVEGGAFGEEAKLTDDVNPTVVFDVTQAILMAIVNRGIYDDGTVDRLLDESDYKRMLAADEDDETFEDFLPEIEQAVDDVMTEPDGTKRSKRIQQFAKDALDVIDASLIGDEYATGTGEALPQGDDYSEAIGEAVGVADELDEDAEGAGAAEADDVDEQDEDLSQGFEESISNEAKHVKGGETLVDEIESMSSMMASNDELESEEIHIAKGGQHDSERRDKARVIARRIGPPLRDAFQVRRVNKMRTGQTFGSFDEDRMIPASRGDPRVFQRKKAESDPKYTAMIMVDRSGSMGGGKMEQAETAVSAFVEALNSCNVDTGVIDLYGNELYLSNPIGGTVSDNKDRLLTGNAGGGTPLTRSVRIAKHRLQMEVSSSDDRPMAFVVTDGAANDRRSFKKEIEKCGFPVVGIYIGDGSTADDLSVYHRGVSVSPSDDLAAVLERLARELVIT